MVGSGGAKSYASKHGYPVTVDVQAEQVTAEEFDAVVIPGGFAPDLMRRSPAMVKLVRDAAAQGKVVAAICHAGWMPVSAGILRGKRATSFFSIKDDLVEEYRANYEGADEFELQPLGPSATIGRERGRAPRPGPGIVALLLIVAVVAVLVVIGLVSGDDEGGEQAARTETTAERTTTQPKKQKRAVPKQVRLRIRTAEPTYVCVDHGPGTDTLENTVIETLVFDMACAYQLAAMSTGAAPMDRDTACTYRESYLKYGFREQMWEANFRRLRRSDPDLFAAIGV